MESEDNKNNKKNEVQVCTNLDDLKYMLYFEPGLDYYDLIFLDITFYNKKLAGWLFAKKLIEDHLECQSKLVMYSARIALIKDELEELGIRYVDKLSPDMTKIVENIVGGKYGQ